MVLGEAVEEHRRHAGELGARAHPPGQDGGVDEPDQRLAADAGEEGGLEVGVAVVELARDRQAVLPGPLARALDLQRAPGVGGELVADEADDGGACPRRAGGVARGDVAELARGLAHPLAGRGRQPRAHRVVEHERDGRLRDAGQRRDVDHGGAAPAILGLAAGLRPHPASASHPCSPPVRPTLLLQHYYQN